ncbi:acyltransferase family protein [Rhodospirillum rubrum]|uniref:Acyltransferase 3 n=1 Tax=Rhodospirillum rubrum (strain ATCC 11170 / ATH 1.1.1 / DSM 467 / LMG 4362 / NCIMB 8255 / S1) TaxID=269796 RepID=Q2RQG7_RHORT|nr:acyltransferase [Rhodospirillum rubrum]ABC23628.1 Acyltransferase 3 [Rhodospirillum rubrum ATCC 11170]AEO49366.1 acyltransferase 3 [Rhodospirillum rubrum F11]MBK5955305.1 acyltransferase [Rhodospirillum rubrum]QXG79589.1 acyltransferase [Rhodospirillum rubrum]HAQ00817.1 acyltransferase [Rhodospirillum rubrum]
MLISDSRNAGGRRGGSDGPVKVDYIDAVRGWAILLVITCHVGGAFPELPTPVKHITNFGWHGVQMFFLASAVTLMMSWQGRHERYGTACKNFMIRRFLRIAPMYYTGALLYFVFDPPASGFDFSQLLIALSFINSWHPVWTPTVDDAWMVVPGGWSIGVEFTFYMLFPLVVLVITSARRALGALVVLIVLAILANVYGKIAFADYPPRAVSNFLYFWFPNQAPIFCCGILLFFLIKRGSGQAPLSPALTYGLIALSGLIYVVVAEVVRGTHYFNPFGVPPLALATLAFMIFILALAKGSPTLFSHGALRQLGTLSFSCYVLHFLVLETLPGLTAGLIDTQATGFAAIGMFALLWAATLGATVGAAFLAHRLIEQPGIALARRLTARGRRAKPVKALPEGVV